MVRRAPISVDCARARPERVLVRRQLDRPVAAADRAFAADIGLQRRQPGIGKRFFGHVRTRSRLRFADHHPPVPRAVARAGQFQSVTNSSSARGAPFRLCRRSAGVFAWRAGAALGGELNAIRARRRSRRGGAGPRPDHAGEHLERRGGALAQSGSRRGDAFDRFDDQHAGQALGVDPFADPLDQSARRAT